MVFTNSFGQSGNFFSPVAEKSVTFPTSGERLIIPDKYKNFQIDVNGLSQFVSSAQSRIDTRSSQIAVRFPLDNGYMETFTIFDSEIMNQSFKPSILKFDLILVLVKRTR